LSLHDALPIWPRQIGGASQPQVPPKPAPLQWSEPIAFDVTLLPRQVGPDLALPVAVDAREVRPQPRRQLELPVQAGVLPPGVLPRRDAHAELEPPRQPVRPERLPEDGQAELRPTAFQRAIG